MKKYILFLFMLPFFAKAQETIFVEGETNNLFVSHIAAPKESFYSIGRLYNISPKEIAPFNNLILENGISIGQTLKIPLRPVNFVQNNKVEKDEAAIPLYHKVDASETLSQISNSYNKVSVASLKAWNSLRSDGVIPGQKIIIGYLKVKKLLSAFAQQSTKIPDEKTSTVVVKETPVKKIDQPKEIVKVIPTPKKEEAPKKTPEPIAEVKQREFEKVKVENAAIASPKKSSKEFKTGFFKSYFLDSGKQENGMAGIFKSTSGWEDGKYYCLQNTASQGAVIKITNPANGKFIYAKVLDVMPDLKQNNNLAIRLSNAAADALGAGTASFECEINY